MPQYEYECEGGHKFELRRSIAERNKVACPDCLKPVNMRVSLPGKPLIATPFTVYGHDGTVLHQTQTTEKTPPPMHRWDNPNLVEA